MQLIDNQISKNCELVCCLFFIILRFFLSSKELKEKNVTLSCKDFFINWRNKNPALANGPYTFPFISQTKVSQAQQTDGLKDRRCISCIDASDASVKWISPNTYRK